LEIRTIFVKLKIDIMKTTANKQTNLKDTGKGSPSNTKLSAIGKAMRELSGTGKILDMRAVMK
jgi:hypothetical protein